MGVEEEGDGEEGWGGLVFFFFSRVNIIIY